MTVQVSYATLLFDLIASVLLGLGTIAFFSPLVLYWFIHGDDARYMWIIQGPYPFSHFGGGPFQLWMGIGLLMMAGILLTFGAILKWLMWRRFDAEFML